MSHGPVLTSDRLILRMPEASDLDDWAAMVADEETMRFIGGTGTRMDAWRQLCLMRGSWAIKGFAMFSVIERASGRWIGRIGPWEPEGWPAKEVGWGVTAEFSGCGYAHEAAVMSMDFAVDTLGWTDVIHVIDPQNIRSQALARRIGSSNRGPTHLPAPLDHYNVEAWGQSADQWRARRRSTG